jgi:hypothetical protein
VLHQGVVVGGQIGCVRDLEGALGSPVVHHEVSVMEGWAMAPSMEVWCKGLARQLFLDLHLSHRHAAFQLERSPDDG